MSSSHLTPLDHMDEIEKQLAELQMVAKEARSPPRPKKVPPVVPPKKKAQPQVPNSSVVGLPVEPSYASKVVSSVPPNAPVYSNVASNSPAQHLDIANRNQYNKSPHLAQSMPFNTNQNSYSNIAYRPEIEELPPPPPPPPSVLSYPPSKLHIDPNMNDEEFIPPPSPVSSNYSELVRATTYPNYQNVTQFPQYQPEYATYGGSQASTYESLYEPINMRPQSAQSNHSLPPNYPPYRNGSARPAVPKEREVDSLTDILIKNIAGNHEDVYGICIKCGKNIVGETAGCTAMGNMYHVKCFTCHICNGNLQGKPFYAVESKPYCEQDYIETLEKCSVCTKPIMDRILRATGKPYHPACFTCVVCGKSLDGIPFTVDAMNQIHCIEDFHKKFAPRCSVCSLPIMPEEGQEETVRVVALDRSFHVRCYRCEDCGLLLSSEAVGRGCYPLDNHILCKSCNAHRVRLLTNVMTTDL